jgi:hypothetical protein
MYPIINDQKHSESYFEIIDNHEGFAHIAFFDSFKSTSATSWITKGLWEVTEINGVDMKNKKVFYTSTMYGSAERHIFSIHFDGSNMTLISPPANIKRKSVVPQLGIPVGSDLGRSGYYRARFSPKCTYFQLAYTGPDTPWERIEKTNQGSFSFM